VGEDAGTPGKGSREGAEGGVGGMCCRLDTGM